MNRRYAFLCLLVLAFLSLGTSRQLKWKRLEGTATAPSGIALGGAPTAAYGENVNNQSCCREQRLDLYVRVPLRNTTDKPIDVAPARTFALVGSTRVALDVEPPSLPSGVDGGLAVSARAAVGNAAFDDPITVKIATTAGAIVVQFDPSKSPVLENRNFASDFAAGRTR